MPRAESELERQLKAAQTRIKNLTAERTEAGKAREAVLRSLANIKKDVRNLRVAVHPDRAPSQHEAGKTKASQIVNERLDELMRKIERAR